MLYTGNIDVARIPFDINHHRLSIFLIHTIPTCSKVYSCVIFIENNIKKPYQTNSNDMTFIFLVTL